MPSWRNAFSRGIPSLSMWVKTTSLHHWIRLFHLERLILSIFYTACGGGLSRVCRSFCPAQDFSVRIFFARRPPSLCRREAIKTSPDQGHRHPKPAVFRAKAFLNGMRARLLIPFSLFRPSSVKGRFGLAPTLPFFLPDGKNGFPRRPGPIPFSAGGAASASRQ